MAAYCVAIIWGILILFSFVGWGHLIVIAVPGLRLDEWGLKAALGMALCVTIGGVLNLAGLISPATICFLVFSGVLLSGIDIISNRNNIAASFREMEFLKRDRFALVCATIVISIIAFNFCGYAIY